MKKKILLGLGSMAAIASPIAAVISCNNDDNKHKENEFEKDIKDIVMAFDATTGGKDVSTQFDGLMKEIERINKLADKEKAKEMKDLREDIFPVIAKITYGAKTNSLSYASLDKDVKAFTGMFQDFDSYLATIMTKEQASEMLDMDIEDVRKAQKVTTVLKAVTIAANDDVNAVKIGDQLNVIAKQMIQPFYIDITADVSTQFVKIFADYHRVKDNEAELKVFILELSKVIAHMQGPYPSGPINKFLSTTEDYVVQDWEEMFDKIKLIAGSFPDDKSAMAYGFTSLEEATSASQGAEKLAAIKKSPDVAGDAKAIKVDPASDPKMAKLARDMKVIADAFDNTTGGRDVSKEYNAYRTERERIANLPSAQQAAAELRLYKAMLPVFAKMSYTTVNQVSHLSLYQDIDDFSGDFVDMKAVVDAITTDADATKYGMNLADVKKAGEAITKISSSDVGPAGDDNEIKIGDQLDDVAKEMIEPFFKDVKTDITDKFNAIYGDFNEVKSDTDAEKYKTFILTLSNVLQQMNASYSGVIKNIFVSTTTDAAKNKWEEMFKNIHATTDGFKTAKAATDYGFDSLEEAEIAAQISDGLSKIKKSPDVPGDANAITIG